MYVYKVYMKVYIKYICVCMYINIICSIIFINNSHQLQIDALPEFQII